MIARVKRLSFVKRNAKRKRKNVLNLAISEIGVTKPIAVFNT